MVPNAAFNPGITAMESAIVNWRLRLLQNPDESIVDAVLVEQEGGASQKRCDLLVSLPILAFNPATTGSEAKGLN